MYCGIGKKQLEVLNTEENLAKVRGVLYNNWLDSCFDSLPSELVKTEGYTLLSTLSLDTLLKMEGGDVGMMLWNRAADNIIEFVGNKYPRIMDIIDASPVLSDDEYYDEYNVIYDRVLPYSLNSIVACWKDIGVNKEVENNIVQNFKKYLSPSFFEGEKVLCSYDVCFCPMVNVSLKVSDPVNLSKEEKEELTRLAIEKMKKEIEGGDKIDEENINSCVLYTINGEEVLGTGTEVNLFY